MPPDHVRHKSSVALLLIDVINHFEFPDGEKVLRNALAITAPLAKLKQRARRAGIPVIYVNDNFGQWRSEARTLLDYCLRSECAAKVFVEEIKPDPEDYFVLKPMHSAFYQTPLEVLLRDLGASSLILTGMATNSCVLCSAHDARMRDFKVIVPNDCCAARSAREHRQAIEHIKKMTDARVLSSPSLRFGEFRA
jgi:nicotinamidase-related amidase